LSNSIFSSLNNLYFKFIKSQDNFIQECEYKKVKGLELKTPKDCHEGTKTQNKPLIAQIYTGFHAKPQRTQGVMKKKRGAGEISIVSPEFRNLRKKD